ncbi:MAG: hypothetical protein CL677_00140 [Bdellovibrionaceae bacterium]|nr:hypothetical protein [Pseudobdellovibrionaceae bacterium]|tara:strand:- start:102636 stop:103805 length:1170 start_codon:yes stop_codon:yes gene_type:complete
MKFVAVVLAFSVYMPMAFGGGWSSSGGEVFRFAKNPWFLKNVSEVTYCVQRDESHFSASKEDILLSIESALSYWRSEMNSQPGQNKPGLAQQRFTKKECSETVDIVFKMGFSTLSQEEVEFLEDPTKYIGVAVRKNYDLQQMRGSGFIYIASDSGPKGYANNGELVERAWRSKKLLDYALIHELGHVFGIPHTGSGVMSEVFLDQLLNRRFIRYFTDNPVQTFIQAPHEFEVCQLSGSFMATFFKAPASVACMRIERKPTPENTWKVSYRQSNNTPLVELGELKGEEQVSRLMGLRPAVVIHLPEEQIVFTREETNYTNFMVGPSFYEMGLQGFYRTLTSRRPYPVYMELKPASFNVVGMVSGSMVPVLVYAPPTYFNWGFEWESQSAK